MIKESDISRYLYSRRGTPITTDSGHRSGAGSPAREESENDKEKVGVPERARDGHSLFNFMLRQGQRLFE